MKKSFRKFTAIIAVLLFALPILLIAVSCNSVEPRSEADVIPATLGTKEGLWLYKGNYRTRTDGTEEEKLLTSVTVNETEYGEDEFSIVKYAYVRGTFEIFYIIQIGEDVRLYHYNYYTKTSSDLFDLPDVEDPRDYTITVTNSLVYVSHEDERYGVIFSRTAQLLYEDFYGTPDEDIVYRASWKNGFEYVKDGVYRSVFTNDEFGTNSYRRCGKYAYLFCYGANAIDLETGECTPLPAFNMEDATLYQNENFFDEYYFTGGSLYVLAVYYPDIETDEKNRLFRFIRVTGNSAEKIYDFGDVPHGMAMKIDGSTIYLEKGSGRDRDKRYFAYDTKTGEAEKISAKTFEENGTSPKALKESARAEKRAEEKRKKIGDYTFYVTSIQYDDQQDYFIGGTYYTKTCYYLNRKNGDTVEVMQYSLNGNRGYFFDDICEI